MKKHHSSRLIGAILLVSGTTIGAAMLAIPISTGRAGFLPSLAVMSLVWLYLVQAALYLLEVNLAFPHHGNIISMASRTLGKVGSVVGWGAYLFLLYALSTAYIAGTSSVFQDMASRFLGTSLSQAVCVLPLLGVFGLLLRHGISVIDHLNRYLMAGLFVIFVALVFLALPHVNGENLSIVDYRYVLPSLSVVITAFGYHVIIPSLVPYLHGNVSDLKKAIWIGSIVPFFAYIVWQCVTLGTVGIDSEHGIAWAYAHGKNGAQLIAAAAESGLVANIAEIFALLAIVTSFLGVSVSLFDCLADGLKIERRAQGKWKLFFFTFVPPLYFAVTYPRIFFTALESAGAFGVVILLALLPAVMCWQKRYRLRLTTPYMAPGGKLFMGLYVLITLLLIGIEVVMKSGYGIGQ